MRRKPDTPDRRGLKIFIGVGILTGLMLFLFWPVVKYLAALVTG